MFSVVIPLYNKELSIRNTIQSVLKQTFQDFEIVVVNDGSTDSSASVVESFKDPRIRLIHQDNQGVSAARNKGVEQSEYDWIAFLDGDDLWRDNHLEEVVKMMGVFPNEKVYVTSFEYSDGRSMFKHARINKVFKIENYFKEAIQGNLICTIVVVIHKSCFDKIGGFNPKLNRGEDLDVWARLAKRYTIIKSSTVTALYRVESENKLTLTSSTLDKSILSLIDLKGTKGYERKYFKNLLNKKLRISLKTFNLKDVFFLLSRYHFHLFI